MFSKLSKSQKKNMRRAVGAGLIAGGMGLSHLGARHMGRESLYDIGRRYVGYPTKFSKQLYTESLRTPRTPAAQRKRRSRKKGRKSRSRRRSRRR